MFNKQILFVVHFDEEAENRSERTETGSLLQFKILPIKKAIPFYPAYEAFWVTDTKTGNFPWNVDSTELFGEIFSLNNVADLLRGCQLPTCIAECIYYAVTDLR